MKKAHHLHVVPAAAAPATPADEPTPDATERADTRGWPMSGPRPRRIDPEETLLRIRVRSALTGIAFWDDSRSPPDDLSIDQVRDVLRWFRPPT